MHPTKLLLSDTCVKHEILLGLKPAELEVDMDGVESDDVAADEEVSRLKVKETDDLSSSFSPSCLTCKCYFDERNQQINHYRSDWHRYNLKQKLLGQTTIDEDQFFNIADALSISGSESDESDDQDFSESTSILKVDEGDNSSRYQDDRRPKFYFKNDADVILSVYKKVVCSKHTRLAELDLAELFYQTMRTIQSSLCLVILFSAGHFAAAVFNNEGAAVTHKTFHRYIVRAKRGTVQSVNDGNNRGHAAKSAGASLRRHNEAALEESVKNLLKSWKDLYFEKCSHVFLRLPKYRKALFYGSKDPIFDPKDSRIRSIPFATRRPTFNELQRVYRELFSILIHGKISLCDVISKAKIDNRQIDTTTKEQTSVDLKIREDIAEDFSTEENPQADSEMHRVKKQKKKRKQNRQTYNEVNKEEDLEVSLTKAEQICVDQLYTACKLSDVEGLTNILKSKFSLIIDQAQREVSTTGDDALGCADEAKMRGDILSHLLANGDTLLHVASRCGEKNMIGKLLEYGADPNVRNSSARFPYTVCKDKETKNAFRRFRAAHPRLYEYDAAQIASPLSEEMESESKKKQTEKKKAQKVAKKEKEKKRREEERIQRKEEEKRKEEQCERERFLALSDREKRLVAVERRLANQPHVQLTQARRCYTCGESLFAKVPFEYFQFQFCSVSCLKIHKSKNSTG